MRLSILKIAHLVCGTLFLAASASLLSTNALAAKLQIVPVNNAAEFFGQGLSVVAKLRCATTKNQTGNNQETWPVCGFFGLSPKAAQKIYYLGPTTSKEVTTSPEAFLGHYESDFVSGVSAWAAQDSTYRSVSVGEVAAPFDDRLEDALPSKRSGESGRLGAKKHPFLSFEAYIDDEALLFHSALDLFSVGSTRVKIPEGTYRSANFRAATNLDDYNGTQESTEATDPKCGDGKRFAILAHDPHSDKDLEALLFQMLNHLQSNFKEVFGTLVVLQEGQYASPPLADAELTPPADSSDPIDVLIKQSYGFWTSAEYAPLNSVTMDQTSEQIVDSVNQFAKKYSVSADKRSTSTLAKQLLFYRTLTKSGDIEPGLGLTKVLNTIESPKPILDRLDGLKPDDANFAGYLIKKINFRGALAYKLYREGYSKASDQLANVKVFGLESVGLYLASCVLEPGCNKSLRAQRFSDLGSADDTGDRWRRVQPYRDWLMAQSALKTLRGLPNSTVPIVLASVRTHLPIVKTLLCRAGISGVMLAPEETGATNALSLLPTTPFSEFFSQEQEFFQNFPAPGGSMKPPVRPEDVARGFLHQ